jgi:hypothetical protein
VELGHFPDFSDLQMVKVHFGGKTENGREERDCVFSAISERWRQCKDGENSPNSVGRPIFGIEEYSFDKYSGSTNIHSTNIHSMNIWDQRIFIRQIFGINEYSFGEYLGLTKIPSTNIWD